MPVVSQLGLGIYRPSADVYYYYCCYYCYYYYYNYYYYYYYTYTGRYIHAGGESMGTRYL